MGTETLQFVLMNNGDVFTSAAGRRIESERHAQLSLTSPLFRVQISIHQDEKGNKTIRGRYSGDRQLMGIKEKRKLRRKVQETRSSASRK
jgi:hypothetical protein